MKTITVKYDGKCKGCGGPIESGQKASWDPGSKKIWHPGCAPSEPVATVAPPFKSAAEMIGQPVTPKAGASLKPKTKTVKPKPIAYPVSSVAPPIYHSDLTATIVPLTQKAKGIIALQSAGMLAKSFATIAQSEETAVDAAVAMGIPCFVRPCPVTPRHGFVDSRVVQSAGEVRGVWKEARDVDPQAELIIMPFVQAEHNMVWRPGLLSVGPGHDGATAGHDSISVFLQPGYSESWKSLATKAGVQLETQDPFVEAVTGPAHSEIVVTQIRGGVKGIVTEPDWNPNPMTVGEVIVIDQATKNLPGKMVAWETEAKALKPGFHVVYNPGGNLGDHYTVHAQLAGVSVVSSFVPKVGQFLPKLGIDLVPLEPQAIVFGFLGGLLSPSLADNLGARQRAVCASVMGAHHGLCMGGDSGVYLGASIAFMLRLGQAALWGEARHGHSHASGVDPKTMAMVGKAGKNRDQIFHTILDDWLKGREGLGDVVKVFHAKWGSSFGGQAWGACGHAIVDLDAAMIELIRLPSRVNAKKAVASLVNAINLAHNNGWWLNKFSQAVWFDLTADLDPRAALMAGPVWYESALVPADRRMDLLTAIEGLSPVDLGQWAGVTVKGKSAKAKGSLDSAETPIPVSLGSGIGAGGHKGGGAHYSHTPSKKLGNFPGLSCGGADLSFISLSQWGVSVPLSAFGKLGGNTIHLQLVTTPAGNYISGDLEDVPETLHATIAGLPTVPSASGSGALYKLFPVTADGIVLDGQTILTWAK